MFARLCRGYALILHGRVAEGVALLDEVMVSAKCQRNVSETSAGRALIRQRQIPLPAAKERQQMPGDARQHSGSFQTWWWVAAAAWIAALVVVVASCLLEAGPGWS
jgi:hypothetical protein